MPRRALALCLALIIGSFAYPALAVPAVQSVQIDFTISFAQGPPISPQDVRLSGFASFYSGVSGPPIDVLQNGPPIDIGNVAIGGSFFASFLIQGPPIDIGFSFAGLTGGFPTFAFDLPNEINGPPILPSEQTGPPILPVGTFLANGPPIDVLGNIVAFDDPVVIGTWEVRLGAVEVPEPGSAILLAAALAGLYGIRRRRTAG
jgi:hypothetical protein